MRVKRAFVLSCGVIATALSASAFAPVPRESAQVLKVTRGRPFSVGAVFVNGKYVEPPYVVERWGTGIRVNGKPVSGQIIEWDEFLKTQKDVRAVRQSQEASAAASAPKTAAGDVDANSLDDLFDDAPKPKKPESGRSSAAAVPRPRVTYELEGEFVPNDSTKAMLARINAFRTEIDRTLRSGGFICFGDDYSQVSGDSRALLDMLEKLPEIQMNARDAQDFCQGIRDAKMLYLNEVLRLDLYRNRADYRKLQGLRAKLKKNCEMQKILDEVSTPLF